MNEENIEIRRLITKAQSYICSRSSDIALCKRAKTVRSLVHKNTDPKTVMLGIEKLKELILEMKAKNIEGFEKLQNELTVFKENSSTILFPTLSNYVGTGQAKIDNADNSEYIELASEILKDLKQNWHIGTHFIPLSSEIETSNEVKFEKVFSRWSDITYRHVKHCIEILSQGREKFGMKKTWSGWNIQTFEILKTVCQLALKAKDQWTPPLIRILIVTAQELRKVGSTGMHGPDRLGAKLGVGKLIGDLSKYDLRSALMLADLTIESISFSRSQVLYAQESNSKALETLINRWHQDEHPMHRDIIAQAYIFIKKNSKAYELLCSCKKHLQTAKSRNYSTSRGEYFVKRYSEHLEDIYIARLSRTLSFININEAFEWCDEIATPNIRIAACLHVLLNNSQSKGELTESRIRDVIHFLKDCGIPSADFWLPAYELEHLPYLRFYPQFPAERWEDLMKQPFTSYDSIIKAITNKPNQH